MFVMVLANIRSVGINMQNYENVEKLSALSPNRVLFTV